MSESISKRDYLARIAPNFSILDTVENYITHENDITNDLFLYVATATASESIETKFLRGIFEVEIETTTSNSDNIDSDSIVENAISEMYNYGDKTVIIAISTNNSPLVLKNCSRVLGVAF